MSTVQRTFIPGSQWVYFKLYLGEKTADELLIKAIVPILKKLQNQQIVEKWFFIRYSDPDFHLRIRLLVYDTNFIGEVTRLFHEKTIRWNKDGFLWKMQLDTYNRELERYGKHLIEEAESFFYADSECILSVIKKLNGNENYRWMIALKLIDSLLSDFDFGLEEKQQLLENLSKSFKAEFGFNEFNSKQFNVKFRENKKNVESVLNSTLNEPTFTALYEPIIKRGKRMMPIVKQIKAKLKNNDDRNKLLSSYLHMMLNRLFRSKNRMHELLLYDFMFRYYSSEIAKKKYK